MIQTRRSLTSAAVSAALALAWPRAGRAQQAMPPMASGVREQLLTARGILPASHRSRPALERTLERWDDLAVDLSTGRVLLVNIAAAELIAYDNGVEALRSRVIVGSGRTRTPQLVTFVTTARLHPPWYVPASIAPEIRAAGAVGFTSMGGRLVQPPGPNNPLGPIRIGLEDSDGIFLHGTNRPALFTRPSRTLSHGCVRVERVRDVASWLLDMPPAAIDAALATGRTQEMHPLQEVRVALAYLTAWPDRDGRVLAYADSYGLDQPGVRRASVRRVFRPLPPTVEQMEAAARLPPAEDNPL